MSWEIEFENSQSERNSGDITSILSYRGQVYSGDTEEGYGVAVFAGSDDGSISMFTQNLCLEKRWPAHKDHGVNHMTIGEDERGTVWLYSCSIWGEIIQWWPAALELLYQNSTTAPGSESKGFTSAGGSLDTTVKQLCFHKGAVYSGDDAGKLCKWSTQLDLEWAKDTYSDIGSLSVASSGAEGEESCLSFLASPLLNQVMVGNLIKRKLAGADSSLEVTNLLPGKSPLTVSPVLRYLACQDPTDYSILVYDYKAKWKQIYRLSGHTDQVSGLEISKCGNFLASCGWDGKVIVWSLQTGEKLSELKCGDYINCVTWHPVTQDIYAGGKAGQIVKIKKM